MHIKNHKTINNNNTRNNNANHHHNHRHNRNNNDHIIFDIGTFSCQTHSSMQPKYLRSLLIPAKKARQIRLSNCPSSSVCPQM